MGNLIYKMDIYTKNFIESHIKQINNNEWESIALDLDTLGTKFVGEFVRIIRDTLGVEIAEYIDYIPAGYFCDDNKLERYNLSLNKKHIGSMAFSNCTNLKYVYIPKNCKEIDFAAFVDCPNLEEIEFESINDVILEDSWYVNCPKLRIEGI